jgi:hypothetical protein
MVWCLMCSAFGANAGSCRCNYGNVDAYEPQCLCSCFSGYLLPDCLYRADDTISVQIWLTVRPIDFYSDQLLQTLAWALPVTNASQLTFLYAHPFAAYNRTAAYVSMKGDRAQQLNWDVTSRNEWLTEANIEAAFEQVETPPESTTYGASLSVYKSSDGKILITVENIMWLVGALVVVCGLAVLDSCCLGNTEVEVEEYYIEHHLAMTNLVDGNLHHAGADEDDGSDQGDKPANPLKPRPGSAAPSAAAKEHVGDPHAIFSDRTRR